MVAYIDSSIRGAIVLKLQPGEDILEVVERTAYERGIQSAQLTAIGALSRAKLGYFDTRSSKYKEHELNKGLEVASLTGNISRLKDDAIVVHAHAVVSDENGNCHGGHVMKGCIVSVTLEVVILELGAKLLRDRDARTGLNLLNLGPSHP